MLLSPRRILFSSELHSDKEITFEAGLFTPDLIPYSHVRGYQDNQSVSPVLQLRLISCAEPVHYDDLKAQHHHRGAPRRIGHAMHYVAVDDGHWIVLISFSPVALQYVASDWWIGWHRQHSVYLLRLVSNNSRLLILPGPSFSYFFRLSTSFA